MSTLHVYIYVHACILRASWCKKPRYCERNFDVFLVVIGINDVWKMESNLHMVVTKFKFNILFVNRLNVQVFCKNSMFSNMYKFNAI